MSPVQGKVRRRHLYIQVVELLKAAIESGEFPSGRLPTEDALVRQFDVSLVTVRKALANLAEQHLIVRRQGSGTYVKQLRVPVRTRVRRRTKLFCYVSGAGYEQFPGNFPNRLMIACQREGETRTYDPIIVRAKEGEIPSPIINNKVDGVIIACTCVPEGAPENSTAMVAEGNERYLQAVAEQDYPVVAISNYTTCPKVHCVLQDYGQGIEAALSHLAKLGHKRVGLIGGPFDMPAFIERLALFSKAGEALELEVGEPWIAAFKKPAWQDHEAAREEIRRLLRVKPRITAAVAISGPPLLALETIRAEGIQVPHDISFIACSSNPRPDSGAPLHIDYDERTTHEMALMVSTVESLAAAAWKRLMQLIEGHSFTPAERVIHTPVHYLPGETVGTSPIERI